MQKLVQVPMDPTVCNPTMLQKKFNLSFEKAWEIANTNRNSTLWMNDTYMVKVNQSSAEVVHLSIKRNDREPVTDWRDKQEIKNQLVGPECEGVELFPAESRLVDTSNQYHLWVLRDPTARIQMGWNQGRIVMNEVEAEKVGAMQRPATEGEKTHD